MKTFKEFLNKKVETPQEIAKKSKVPVDIVKKELQKGTKVEKEHTTKKEVAKTIASAHVGEDPKYYEKLTKAKLEEHRGDYPLSHTGDYRWRITSDVRGPNDIKPKQKYMVYHYQRLPSGSTSSVAGSNQTYHGHELLKKLSNKEIPDGTLSVENEKNWTKRMIAAATTRKKRK